jgi:hypothetical protein
MVHAGHLGGFTADQRAPGATPMGRTMKTKAASSATTAAVPKKCRVITYRTARCASASSIDAGGDGAKAGFTTGGVLADVLCKTASLAPRDRSCSLVFPARGYQFTPRAAFSCRRVACATTIVASSITE